MVREKGDLALVETDSHLDRFALHRLYLDCARTVLQRYVPSRELALDTDQWYTARMQQYSTHCFLMLKAIEWRLSGVGDASKSWSSEILG